MYQNYKIYVNIYGKYINYTNIGQIFGICIKLPPNTHQNWFYSFFFLFVFLFFLFVFNFWNFRYAIFLSYGFEKKLVSSLCPHTHTHIHVHTNRLFLFFFLSLVLEHTHIRKRFLFRLGEKRKNFKVHFLFARQTRKSTIRLDFKTLLNSLLQWLWDHSQIMYHVWAPTP